MLIQINYLVNKVGDFYRMDKMGEVEKIEACFKALAKPFAISLGWWETQPKSPAQVSMGQGEFGPRPTINVSHLFLLLASEYVCTIVLHYRQARPTPRKIRVWKQWSVPRASPF